MEKTVNEFAKEASREINKEELSSLEQGRTRDQFGDEASFEIHRKELSSVDQEETVDQMGIEASCESHADMSDPALYIHSMEKLDLATRKRLISQGAFQPKAHEMNEKRFPTLHQDVVLMIVLSVKAGTTQKLEKTISKRRLTGTKKNQNKANDFTCKLQYDVSIFSNRRQSDFTKCSFMISQREIMISRLV